MQAMSDAPEPPQKLEPAAITGKIIGYRRWTLDGYKLLSSNPRLKGYWSVGVNRAECRHHLYLASQGVHGEQRTHDAPDPNCECGLYAWHSIELLKQMGVDGIYGAVTAWGKIETHSTGFRAEYAEPVVLAYEPSHPYQKVIQAKAIAEEMGLPFLPLDELADAAKAYGGAIDESLLPDRPSYGGGGAVFASNYVWSSYVVSGNSSGTAVYVPPTSMVISLPTKMKLVRTGLAKVMTAFNALLAAAANAALQWVGSRVACGWQRLPGKERGSGQMTLLRGGKTYVHGIHACDKRLRSLPHFNPCHCQPPEFVCACGRRWEHLCDEAEGCMYWCVGDFKRVLVER